MIDKTLFALPGIKRVLLFLAAFAVLTSVAVFGQAWSLSSAITGLWYGNELSQQFIWIALFLLSFIGFQIIMYFQDLLLDRFAHQQADELRQNLMQVVFTQGEVGSQQNGTGKTTTMLLEGIEQVEIYLRLILQKMVRLIVVPLLLLIPVFYLDWVSGVVMVIVFPFIIFYMVLLGRVAQNRAAKQHQRFQILANHFVDSLRGIDTLKLFGISKKHGANIYKVSEKFRKATIKTLRTATLSSAILDLFATLSVAAVAILLGLRLLDGSLVLFPALTVLVLAPEYFKPLREFASDFHASLDGRNALRSILEMTGVETTTRTDTLTTEPVLSKERGSWIDSVSEPTLRLDAWNTSSRLAFCDLGHHYSAYDALRNLSFEVTGNVKVGIIGTSGAGKSTLINVLGGFSLPGTGLITLDESSVSHLRHQSWQQQIAYLPQDPYIFHATLAENIAFYCPDATVEEIEEAVSVVGLESLVNELPHGLDTRIGEGARALSGGQAQRVALARVCLDRSRSILLFDEPTAHLDIETELELKQRMLPLMQNRLVFFATHRLHWMQNMDFILVMDRGTIVASGTLEELLDRSEYFSSLVGQLQGGVL